MAVPVQKPTPALDRIFAVALTLLLGYYFIIAPSQEAWSNYWLVKDAQEGTAIVTKELWTGHNVVQYRYRVNQKEYTGQDRRSRQDPRYANVLVGERSPVYFSSSHPWLSALNRPHSAMIEGLPVVVLVWFLIALLVITAINPNNKWALKFSKSQTQSRDG
ncbi:MAG TPA: hypothetical protein VGR55_02515 [Candidatus Acidoferrum sp.]|nr:hypothetical protein [Candidatus Acidoferrum sp.]